MSSTKAQWPTTGLVESLRGILSGCSPSLISPMTKLQPILAFRDLSAIYAMRVCALTIAGSWKLARRQGCATFTSHKEATISLRGGYHPGHQRTASVASSTSRHAMGPVRNSTWLNILPKTLTGYLAGAKWPAPGDSSGQRSCRRISGMMTGF